MCEKKSNLSMFLLILLIVLILTMGYFMYNLYTSNQIEADKINNLDNEISDLKSIINNLKESIEKENNNENHTVNNIILEGSYGIDASDMSYEFSTNGDVEFITNTTNLKGKYTTVDENEIEICFTEKTVWDDVTNETITTKINTIEKIVVVDNNTLTFKGEDDGQEYNGTIIKF